MFLFSQRFNKKKKNFLLGKFIIQSDAESESYNNDEQSEIIQQQKQTSKPLSLKKKIALFNDEQKIFNEEKFGPISKDTILITIQVHTRIDYLRYLIDSFKNAKDIDKVLLIFSHDVYDNAINQLVRAIDFCMVMQIYYPYSIQLYPNTFPGTDPRDCGRDIGQLKAKKIKCINANYIDTYSHYREAKYTQMKHHWWWKLNRIFDELKITKDRQDVNLLLIEEDHYVASDFLHIYKQMQRMIPRECPKCNIISLGTYFTTLDESNYNKVDISPWTTSKHNMAMAFNKTTWAEARNCAEFFCNYDEYNYDFSFQNINRKCLKDKLFTALIRGPRVYHVGECGVHHSKQDCDVKGKIREINADLKAATRQMLLSPEDLEIGSVDMRGQMMSPLINNGGWADKRDQCLCLKISNKQDIDINCRNHLSTISNDTNDL